MGHTRKYTIGQTLGIELALNENDLSRDSGDETAMAKVREIAEIYANFSSGGLEGFKEDFQKGYQIGVRDLEQDADNEPSRYSQPHSEMDGPS